MKPVSEPANSPSYVQVRLKLLRDIATGVWPLGGRMTLSDLEARYGVSQSPVREALLRLEGDGVVVLHPHRGAVVPQVDAALLTQVYDIIGALQGMLARRAVDHLTRTHLRELEAHLARFDAALDGGDIVGAVAANGAFHGMLNSLGGNPQAKALIETRFALAQATRRLVGYSSGRTAEVKQQHQSLLAALILGDGEAAAQVLVAHADTARDDLIARLLSKGAASTAS